MSGSGDNQYAEEIAAEEAQEKELKAAQDVTGKAPSRSNGESSDDSSSDSDSDSDSSDEDVKDDDDAARKAAKKRRKEEEKKAKKLLMKMIKKEQASTLISASTKCPTITHNFRGTTLTINFIPCIWESLLISMGKTIPNGLMICKCTFTGFTLLFGRLWL
jgi:hypothetical protein